MTAPALPSHADRHRASGWLLVVLTLAYMLSFLDRMVVNLLVEPMKRDLGLGDTQVSLLMGFSFALFYTLCGLPLGRLADRTHRRNLIAGAIALWSLMTVACGLARSYGALFAARVGVGAGEAALTPAATSMIADSVPRERLGRALGIYALGIYAGSGVALLVGALAIRLAGVQDDWVLPLVGAIRPWQLVFMIVGLPGLLVAAAVLLLREPPRRDTTVASWADVRAWMASRRRVLVGHHVGFGLLALVAYAGAAWMPSAFVRSFGWTVVHAAVMQGAATAVFSVAGCISGGWLSDRFARTGGAVARLRVGVIGAVGLAVSAAAFAWAPGATLAMVAIVPLLFFAAFPFGAASATLADLAPSNMRGTVSAAYLFCISVIGIGIGPTAVALVTDHVFHDPAQLRASIGIVAVLACAGAFVALRAGLRDGVPATTTVPHLAEAR
jgi:MFS family permease